MTTPQPQDSLPQSRFPPSSQCPISSSPMASAPAASSPSAIPSSQETSPHQTQPAAPFLSPVSASDRCLASNPNRLNPRDPSVPVPESDAPGVPLSSGPSKIPFRPRKARKLAATGCPAKQETEDKAEVASREGNKGAMGSVVVVHRYPRSVYLLPPRPLSAQGEVAAAIGHLRAADPHLAQIIDANEAPVFQSLHPPFHSLTRSILYQQLAFKAAASIYSRFLALCGGEDGVVPDVVLSLSAHQLRQIGVSARKASYLHDLANKYRNGILSDSSIVAMDDKSLFAMLNMVKGIGAWSVHMFMIFSLHRPDVLPVGDVGVRKGVQLLYSLDALPRPSQMEHICESWKPYRSVGSWYMWRLVETKGMPAALATVSSGGSTGMLAAATGVGGSGRGGHIAASPIVGVSSALTPHLRHQLPQQHTHLHPQQQTLHRLQQQHQHQAQHQHQLQMQSQLVDAIHSIPNLG
ncbi:uncharacterized protein LOC144715144 [Wolffia australiana]